jgi:hypothetical protein
VTDEEYREELIGFLDAVLDRADSVSNRANCLHLLRRELEQVEAGWRGVVTTDALDPPDGAEPDRAAEYEKARREGEGRCRPCRSGQHDRCLRPFIGEGADFCCCVGMDALEGATEGGGAIEQP